MKKIDRIILFGDSFIQGTGCFNKLEDDGRMIYNNLEDDNRGHKLTKFQNHEGWGKNLKKYFPNVEIINHGVDGGTNYESFEKLNIYFNNDYRKSDLILFGFTSKFRDFGSSNKFIYNTYPMLLHEENPLNRNPLAWDRKDFHTIKNYWAHKNYPKVKYSLYERNLSNKFILDYVNNIHDDSHLNYIANTNYVFLQHWAETYNLNFYCFDLFENYVVGDIGNFKINKNIYINYSSKKNNSLLSYLQNMEITNPIEQKNRKFWVSYFEHNENYINSSINEAHLVHPNQFGYEKIVDFIYTQFLQKKYI